MRCSAFACLIALVLAGFVPAMATRAASSGAKAASVPTSQAVDPTAITGTGWIDLLGDVTLEDWIRVPLPPGSPLGARNPWSYDRSARALLCDGTGSDEIFLHRTLRGDGVLRVEWRFVGAPANPNAGIFIRTRADKSAWFESRLSPDGLGTLYGVNLGRDGKPKRFAYGTRRPTLLHKPEEWNVTEFTSVGTRLILKLNGTVAADWNECNVPEAQVGIRSDGTAIEFRAILFKPVP